MGHVREFGRRVVRGLLVVALFGGLLAFGAADRAAAARPIPPPLHVFITDTGFVPDNVSVTVGQTVVFENQRAVVDEVTATDGVFASGPIPAGGAYVMALAQLGVHQFESAGTPAAVGTLAVGALGLDGPDNSFATGFIPTDPPYPIDARAIDFHPSLGFAVTRNRLLVKLATNARVGDFNNALAAAGATVVGGFERWGLVAVEVPDTGGAQTWTLLDAAVAALDASPTVATVTYDIVMQESNEIPRPLHPDPGTATWDWNDVRYGPGSLTPGSARGDGANGWLESARFPQAWNWYDTLVKKNSPVDTVVLDVGFDPLHPDLANVAYPSLCIPYQSRNVCTFNDTASPVPGHGTGTAATIGGPYDRAGSTLEVSNGLPGANPVADVTIVRTAANFLELDYKNPMGLPMSKYLLILDIVMANRNSAFPSLRVINLSAGQFMYGDPFSRWHLWYETRQGKLCGPGDSDDAGGLELCTPLNDDQNILWVKSVAETLRPVMTDFSQQNIMFVKSSGNDNGTGGMCIAGTPGTPSCVKMILPTGAIDGMAYLGKHWTGPGANPIMLVEAFDTTKDDLAPRRAEFADPEAHVSAQGVEVWTADSPTPYSAHNGTSFAAPQVAALAGMLWELNPSASLGTVRGLIVDNARDDVREVDWQGNVTAGLAAPRIDAWASMMASVGGAFALVDVNDPSTDGNRRIQWFGGTPFPDNFTGPANAFAAPDGQIDMRDFRRFRDAWLAECLADNTQSGCPDSIDIDLDGEEQHHKRDLNADRCHGFVFVDTPSGTDVVTCPTEEEFSRFDFNGDGQIDPTREARVPITPNGEPSTMLSGTDLSDLGVLQAKWTGGGGANVPATALPGLLTSADVAIDADDITALTDPGTLVSTFVNSGPNGVATPPNVPPGGAPHYVTSAVDLSDTDPTGGQTNQLEAWAVATVDGVAQSYVGSRLTGYAGSDLRTRICDDTLLAASDKAAVPIGTASHATLTFTSLDCDVPRVGVPMRYEIVGDALGSALTSAETVTNASGRAQVNFNPGNQPGVVTVRAYAAVGLGGREVSRDIEITVGEGLAVHYAWRETLLDWEVNATNQWGLGEDDCDDNPTDPPHPANLCFAAKAWLRPDAGFTNTFGVPTYQNLRRGTIKLDDQGGTLIDEDIRAQMVAAGQEFKGWQISEHVDQWAQGGTPHFDPTHCDSYQSGQCPVNVVGYTYYRDGVGETDDDWSINWRDNAIPGLSLEERPDGLLVSGLRSIAEQQTSLIWNPTNATHDDAPLQIPNYPTEILLEPRENASNFQYGPDVDTPLHFAKSGGGYDDYSYCGVVEQDLTVGPGYWSNDDEDLDDGIRDRATRRPVRSSGDRAAPMYEGVAKSRIQFVAIVAPVDFDIDLGFPSCTKTEPDLFFSVSQQRISEGDEVTFEVDDPAAGPDAVYSWDFRDGTTSVGQSTPKVFDQSGTFKVKLTVEEPGEPTRTVERNIVVENVAPAMSVEGLSFDGTNWKLDLAIGEPSTWDAYSMRVDVTAPTQPPYSFFTYVTPESSEFDIDPLPVGVYQLTVKVTDPDGAFSTERLEVSVTQQEEEDGGSGAPPAPFGPTTFISSSRPVEEQAITTELIADGDPIAGAVSGYVVSALDATTGDGVSVRNASMRNGVPVNAAVDAGDGRAAVALAPGAMTTLGYLDAGDYVIGAIASGAPTATAATQVHVDGPARPPVVTYSGATTAVIGLPATMRASVTTAGGVPLAGRTVQFVINGTAVEVNSGAGGIAQTTLPVPGPAGATTVQVEVLATASGPSATTSAPFTVLPNAAPSADAGGPYNLVLNTDLELEGTGTDTDAGEQASLQYAWDLDGDGTFGDASGAAPTVAWDGARTVICGGTCTPGASYQVTLRVTDAKGAVALDTADVTVARDFAIAILPNAGALVPNSATSFEVHAVTDSGWNTPITLSAPGLPSGVSASFNPSTISVGQKSLLTLIAGSTISPGTFGVTVQGTSAGVVRQAGGSLTLDFGLIPACFGDVSGRVLDRETKQPVAGAFVGLPGGVSSVPTAADGTFHLANVPVSGNNGPRSYSVSVSKSGYRPLSPAPQATAACGVATVVPDIEILAERFAAVSGTLIGHTRDGAPLGPINGPAQQGAVGYGGPSIVTPNANGAWSFSKIALGADNAPADLSFQGSAGGFYSATTVVPVGPDTVTTGVVIDIEKRCTAPVRVRVVVAETGEPLANARVVATFSTQGFTDANGYVTINTTLLPKAQGNALSFTATTPTGLPFLQRTMTTGVAGCGQPGSLTIPLDVHIPVPNYGQFEITVVDKETGDPIADAEVFPTGLKTNAQGKLSWQAFVGNDSDETQQFFIQAVKTGYWNSVTQQHTLHKDETIDVLIEMVKPKHVAVEGTITDRITGAPLANARVSISNVPDAVFTGPDGMYRFESVILGSQNTAREHLLSISKAGYWSDSVTVAVSPDEPVTTVDASIVQICRGATVRGRVINALTGEPIEAATVDAGNLFVQTDAEGRFVLDPLPPGRDNEPWRVTVTARKTGFLTASKSITLFCGADVIVDFGRTESAFGAIAGRVTNEAGDPLAGIFVGSAFGGSDTTDTNGEYSIANAPLADDGSPRDWAITASPAIGSGYGSATKSATVTANETTQVDFVLGDVNLPPAATPLSVQTMRFTPVGITLLGFDAEGADLGFIIVDPPQHGALTGIAPNLTYTPTGGFVGNDSFTYKVFDGVQESDPATIDIEVITDENPPDAEIELTNEEVLIEGDMAHLDASSSSDIDGTIELYEWDLDEDGQFDDATGPTASLVRADDGDVEVAVRVTDDDGLTDETEEDVDWENAPPQFDLGAPAVIEDGEPFERDVVVTDPGEDDEHYAYIYWGDGEDEEIEVVDGVLHLEHEYSAGFGDFFGIMALGAQYEMFVEVCDEDDCTEATLPVFVGGLPDELADLSIDKTHEGDLVTGEEAEYSIVVTNHGPSAAENVVVTDPLDGDLEYVDAEGDGWNCDFDDDVLVCEYDDDLEVGDAPPITLTVVVLADDEASNAVMVQSGTPDLMPINNFALDVAPVGTPTTTSTSSPVTSSSASTTSTSTSSTTSSSTSTTTSSTPSTSTSTSTTTTTVPPTTTSTATTTSTSTSTTTSPTSTTTSTSTTSMPPSTTSSTVATTGTTSTSVTSTTATTSSTVPSPTTATAPPVTGLASTVDPTTTTSTTGSGSASTGSSSGGGSLPRTGQGLALMWLGFALMGAGVLLHRRRIR